MHKNALFLLKNCKNRPKTSPNLPIEKSWLRYCCEQWRKTPRNGGAPKGPHIL